MRRLTARRVCRLRRYVAANRCPLRPGLTHDWVAEVGMDPTSLGGVVEWQECLKCGAT